MARERVGHLKGQARDKEYVKDLLGQVDACSFDMMAKNLHLLIIVLDRDLVLRFANQNFFDLVGWTEKEVIDRDYTKHFIPPRLRPFVHGTVSAILAKKANSYSGSNEVMTRDQGVRYVNWNAVHLCDVDGETKGLICFGLDITDHQNLDDILNRVDLEKNLLLYAIREPVVYHDSDGRVTWANRAFLESTGRGLDDLLGAHLRQLMEHVEDGGTGLGPLRRAGGEARDRVVKLADGRRWLGKSYPLRAQDVNPDQLMMILHPLAEKADTASSAVKTAPSGRQRMPAGFREEAVFQSEAMLAVRREALLIHRDRSAPVLIEGETGVGKEVIARYIHHGEDYNHTPFIDINCAAITPTIFESELFGYEGGAFTGGRPGGQRGKIALADGGTLFLDEISEIPTSIQAKLLRVIQEREYYPVGGLAKHKTDLRLVCASNADLGACVREGRFRKDLYYRLEAIRIHVPPLRDRPEDILPLAKRFLRAISEDKGKSFRDISSEAAGVLLAHSWPGNVRQLRNAMERVVIMWDETELRPEHLAFLGSQAAGKRGEGKKSPAGEIDEALPAEGLDLQELNQRIIRRALALHGGNITKTAQYLGMSRRSLSYRLKNMSAEN